MNLGAIGVIVAGIHSAKRNPRPVSAWIYKSHAEECNKAANRDIDHVFSNPDIEKVTSHIKKSNLEHR